jgi:hypothetical protein
MRYLFLLLFFCNPTIIFSQVGIGTVDPLATLDVNGTIMIRTTNQAITTIKIGGLDDSGAFREIEIGNNIILKDNVLSAQINSHSFGNITTDDNISNELHNVDLLIGPGEMNANYSIIRLQIADGNGDIKFTGIKAGFDGQSVWLYPQDGKLELKENDANSLNETQIEKNKGMKADQYNMIQIVYDAARNRWNIMYHG